MSVMWEVDFSFMYFKMYIDDLDEFRREQLRCLCRNFSWTSNKCGPTKLPSQKNDSCSWGTNDLDGLSLTRATVF